MEEQLIQAYYWLSSAIAQAFAALIAFTVIVYIYRLGKIRESLTEIANIARLLLADIEDRRNTPEPEPTGPFVPNLLNNRRVNYLVNYMNHGRNIQKFQLKSNDSVINNLRNFVDEPDEFPESKSVRQNAQYWITKYDNINRNPKSLILSSIIISAFTMLFGIVALLIGSIIPCDTWGWIVMIVESSLAAIALGWTVYVVIKMLAEPEEPKSTSPSTA